LLKKTRKTRERDVKGTRALENGQKIGALGSPGIVRRGRNTPSPSEPKKEKSFSGSCNLGVFGQEKKGIQKNCTAVALQRGSTTFRDKWTKKEIAASRDPPGGYAIFLKEEN